MRVTWTNRWFQGDEEQASVTQTTESGDIYITAAAWQFCRWMGKEISLEDVLELKTLIKYEHLFFYHFWEFHAWLLYLHHFHSTFFLQILPSLPLLLNFTFLNCLICGIIQTRTSIRSQHENREVSSGLNISKVLVLENSKPIDYYRWKVNEIGACNQTGQAKNYVEGWHKRQTSKEINQKWRKPSNDTMKTEKEKECEMM